MVFAACLTLANVLHIAALCVMGEKDKFLVSSNGHFCGGFEYGRKYNSERKWSSLKKFVHFMSSDTLTNIF